MKAMILAAGRGERMGRLTAQLPKPLLTVNGVALIDHVLLGLKQAGIVDVVINVSYLPEKIIGYVGDGSRFGMSIIISNESGKALGTGGGIRQALQYLGGDPFLLISADIWTDYPLRQLIGVNHNSLMHLVLVDNPDYHPRGDYSVDEHGCVGFGLLKKTYAGIARVNPSIFDGVSKKVFSLTEVLDPAVNQAQVSGEYYAGDWCNVGDPQQLTVLG